jgi:hypothetical protein
VRTAAADRRSARPAGVCTGAPASESFTSPWPCLPAKLHPTAPWRSRHERIAHCDAAARLPCVPGPSCPSIQAGLRARVTVTGRGAQTESRTARRPGLPSAFRAPHGRPDWAIAAPGVPRPAALSGGARRRPAGAARGGSAGVMAASGLDAEALAVLRETQPDAAAEPEPSGAALDAEALAVLRETQPDAAAELDMRGSVRAPGSAAASLPALALVHGEAPAARARRLLAAAPAGERPAAGAESLKAGLAIFEATRARVAAWWRLARPGHAAATPRAPARAAEERDARRGWEWGPSAAAGAGAGSPAEAEERRFRAAAAAAGVPLPPGFSADFAEVAADFAEGAGGDAAAGARIAAASFDDILFGGALLGPPRDARSAVPGAELAPLGAAAPSAAAAGGQGGRAGGPSRAPGGGGALAAEVRTALARVEAAAAATGASLPAGFAAELGAAARDYAEGAGGDARAGARIAAAAAVETLRRRAPAAGRPAARGVAAREGPRGGAGGAGLRQAAAAQGRWDVCFGDGPAAGARAGAGSALCFADNRFVWEVTPRMRMAVTGFLHLQVALLLCSSLDVFASW